MFQHRSEIMIIRRLAVMAQHLSDILDGDVEDHAYRNAQPMDDVAMPLRSPVMAVAPRGATHAPGTPRAAPSPTIPLFSRAQ
jgi:hypothetical protein